MKKQFLLLALLLGSLPSLAQLKFRNAGPIVGYTKLYANELTQMVGRYPVNMGQTDMDHLRLGAYASFALPRTRLLLRPELSYVNHSLWTGAQNPFHDSEKEAETWISSGSGHPYNRLEATMLMVSQHRFWHVHAGLAGWHVFDASTGRKAYAYSPSRQAIFLALDRSFNPYVGAVKIGAGLSLGRLHLEANYVRNATRVLRSELAADGQTTRLGRLDVASVTYDIRFDVFRKLEQ
ncbi:hypothetical protein [Hymenobacter lapidiphilus]|uniref:DUF3575 domain-containing protein n=1 Tax=Hymenobacter lapidiphilus TaxID=2608003 RepID=A0A7Y7U6B4_9BACT|nr:hypothetical protein [Hymenobacter lapidiphilus]NVO31589.1 hypothetical protein [Hymenobacter lapidiphilus]